MSSFGDSFNQVEEDPAAEFLAREQDELAGLEDEVKPAAIAAPLFNGGKYSLRFKGRKFSEKQFLLSLKHSCFNCLV